MSVFPYEFPEEILRRIGLQNRERLAGNAFASEPRCARIPLLRHSGSVPVTARAVASKYKLVFVPF
jgi:hypothetical protein